MFTECSGLKEVYISKNIRTIEERTFFGCDQLKKIRLPSGLKEIGYLALADCTSLTELDVPETVTEIGFDALRGVPWFENQTNEFVLINSVLARYCGNAEILRETDFNLKIESVAGGAFRNTKLKEIYFPDRIGYIGAHPFFRCEALEKVKLPSGMECIPEGCFSGISSLKEIIVGNNVKTLKEGSFRDTSLTYLSVWDGVTTIDRFALFSESFKSIVLPETIEVIHKQAFYRCHESYPYHLNIFYKGSEIKWQRFIEKNGDDFLYGKISVYFYSESKPVENRVYWHWVNGEPVIWEISETGESGSENAA